MKTIIDLPTVAILLLTLIPESVYSFSINSNNANTLTLRKHQLRDLNLPSLHSAPAGAGPGTGSGSFGVSSVASKFYQLEEREDAEECTTEIFLMGDGTVNVSDTNGPPPLKAMGSWSQNGDEFRMNIKRTFGTGHDGSDLGEFQFEVERNYVGIVESVAGLVSMDGSMHLMVRKAEIYELLQYVLFLCNMRTWLIYVMLHRIQSEGILRLDSSR